MYEVKAVSAEEKEKVLESLHARRPLFEKKADIYGCCVKLFTDSEEFFLMWNQNFHSMLDSIRPHGRVLAFRGTGKEKISYEPTSKTAIIENCDYYGKLKSVGLAVVADYLEDVPSEHRRHSIHGSYVDLGGRGIAIIGPSKSGKTTLTYGLLMEGKASFLTDDWLFVRMGHDVVVHSSEKNSYIRGNIDKDWPAYRKMFKRLKPKYDNKGRAIMDVRMLFGEDKLKSESVMGAVVVLTRDKKEKPFRRLSAKEALSFMLENDFCNPHQLVRSPRKKRMRVGFFRELFGRVPVYLLNTVETPAESLARLKKVAEGL
jgi:hypothetical protein